MERYYTQAINAEAASINGEPIGRILEVVVEPDTGKIAGFLLYPRGQNVISPSDIVFWDQHIIIQNPDDILKTSEIIKVKRALDKNIPIIKNRVYTEDKLYLGTVTNFSIDTKLFILTKLVVAKNFLNIFHYDEKIIPHKNIIEIKKDGIVVKNPMATIKIKAKLQIKGKLYPDIAAICKKYM